MEKENLPIEQPKLNFFQKIRKRILLRNITPSKYQKNNFPEYLKNDVDILCSMIKKDCNSFNSISKSQQRLILEHMPEIFLSFDFTVDRQEVIRQYPQEIAKIFDKLTSLYKESLLEEYPEHIKELSRDEAIGYILGGMNRWGKEGKKDYTMELIKFLPEEVQIQLLTKNTNFIDIVRGSNYEQTKSPYDFRGKLEYFSEKVIVEAVSILTERAKTETREKVPLLSYMEIHDLPVEMQLKLVSIDKELINQMSGEAIVKYLDNNPLVFLNKLDIKKQIEVIKQKPEYFKVLSHRQKIEFLDIDQSLKDYIPDIDKINYRWKTYDTRLFTNVKDIKENIVQKYRDVATYAEITNCVKDTDVLIELGKFEPSILSTWRFDDIKAAKKIGDIIEIYKTKTQNPEILQELEKLKINTNNIETLKRNSITTNIAKVLLNERVMNKVNPEVIADFIRESNIEKLKGIIVETYGEHVEEIFKDRPNISMDQIHNLDIFDEKIIEKFGIGAIHNMLSYDSHTSAIIGELARNTEKMQKFEMFSEVVGDYFEDTPLGFENKLSSFYRIEELFSNVKLEDFTSERRQKLLTAINDINMTHDVNETDLIRLENLEDLDKYKENRDKIYNDYLKHVDNPEEVKELICRKIFGMPYGESTNEQYKQNNLNIKDMLYYYNLESFVSDERTKESELFTEDELDQLELVTIIDKINDVEVLQELYEVLSEREEELLGPADFNTIKNKIPEQYSQELVDSLLTVEQAKRRAEEGENGISYIQTEDGQEIIKLHGADFRILMHSTGLNNSQLPIPWQADPAEVWKYFENGCSTISGCVIEPEMLYSCAGAGRINIGFSNVPAKQIIGMSHHDAHVSHMRGRIDPEFDYYGVKFNYPDELVRKTAAQITGQESKDVTHEYNEVAMYRKNINPNEIGNGTLGGKVMPDYIVVYGEVNDYHKEMAKKFSTNDNPIPIMQIDVDAYPDRTYARGYKKEEHSIERESGEIVKKVKGIIDTEER